MVYPQKLDGVQFAESMGDSQLSLTPSLPQKVFFSPHKLKTEGGDQCQLQPGHMVRSSVVSQGWGTHKPPQL